MKKFLPVILIALGFLLPLIAEAQIVCPPSINTCETADPICGPVTTFENPNPDGAPDPFPGCPSNVIDNEFWHRFVPLTTDVTFSITSSGCQNGGGIQAGMYSDCANLNTPLLPPQCGCTTGPITFSAGGLTPGVEYYIMVDGCAGDICDVVISLVNGQIDDTFGGGGGGGGGGGNTPAAPYGNQLIVCHEQTTQYFFEVIGPGTYTWFLDGGRISTGVAIPGDCNGATGEGSVTIDWFNFSNMPSDDCFTLTYEYVPDNLGCDPGSGAGIESDPLEICFDDPVEDVQGFFCWREEPDGFFYTGDNMFYFDGDYQTVLPPDPTIGEQCPTYINLEVTSFLAIDSFLFYEVCPGDSVEIEGEFYHAPFSGNDTIVDFYDVDPNGEKFCDKYLTLEIIELDPNVNIVPLEGTTVITCIDTVITLFADSDPTDVDYVWSTPDGTIIPISDDTIQVRTAGTYIVTIAADGFGGIICNDADTIVITDDIVNPTASATKTDIVCGGQTNGAATASGAGGITPYTYAWSNGPTTASINNLAAGTYTVTITGANGCTDVASVTILEPDPIALTPDDTDAECNGGNDGTASVSVTGGTGAYTYAWSTTPTQTTATATGLTAGTYTVTVTDANGCTETETIDVGEALAITSTISSTPTSCNGGNDGTATVTANGGTGAFTYAWSSTPIQINPTATGLPTGTYTVTITDANGCTHTNSVVVDDAPAITITASGSNALCNGGDEGSATASANGGAGSFNYVWSTTPQQTGPTATGLTAGTYTVTATDANSCTITEEVIITEPNALQITLSGINPRCNTSADGSVTVVANGGTGTLTYAWSTSPVQSTSTASLIPAGTYTVTVTDSNGCSIEDQVTINAPNALVASLDDSNDATCNGVADGTATISGSGGTPGYTYQWPVAAGGQTTATVSNLASGTYTPTITDNNGCTETVTVVIDQPAVINVTANVDRNVLCNGDDTGDASATGNGGTGAYTFAWSSGTPGGLPLGATVTGLGAGTHTVTITDANGCSTTDEITVTEPPVLSVNSASFTDPLCNSVNDGTATVDVVGGTPNYTYAWSGSASVSNTATDLLAGTHTVTITDNNGCSVTQEYNLTDPDAVVASIASTTDVLCSYTSDGTAEAMGSGGTAPYTYTWSTGTPNGNSVTGLPIGTITVTVTDANSCSSTASATIGAPPALDLQMSQSDALCKGEDNGSASVVVTGGTTPYTYNWSSGALTDIASGVFAGPHTVTITDANGCTAENSIVVGEPQDALTMTGTSTDATCGDANGCIDLTPAGGTPGYTYSWPDGDDRQNRCDLAPGTYNITVTDANACTFVEQIIVTTANQFQIDAIAAVDVICFGESNGAVNVDISGGVPPYTYAWDGWVSTNEDISGVPTGTYTITVTDNTGCTLVADAFVNQPDILEVTNANIQDSDCAASTGSVTVQTAGGVQPYTYSWSGGASTTATLDGVPLGDYTVTITDANGCSITDTRSVGNPDGPEIEAINGRNLDCFEDNTGEVEVIVRAGTGTPPFTYNWEQGLSGSNPLSLPAGTYTVTVVDSRQCEVIADVVLTEPNALAIDAVNEVPALCGASNGSVEVLVSGGTQPYTYEWPGLPDDTENPRDLPPGNYVVNITDANGCTIQASGSTVAPGEVQISATPTDALCFNGNDGSIDVTLTGGTGPFTFAWDYQAADTEDLTSLPQGDYILTVTDGNGCTFVNRYTVNHPDELEATTVAQDATCGNNDGNISLGVTGGVQPYTYAWSNGPTTQNNDALLPGNYTVTITDQNGCILIHNADPVELPDGPQVSFASVIDAQCKDAIDGVAELTITGGTQPYTYQWSAGTSTSASVTDLPAGPVSVTITDAKNCEVILDTMITEPDELLRDQLTINEATCGDNNGSIDITMMGGTGPYTYNWTPTLPNSPNQANLGVGVYFLQVVDAQGCIYEESFNVSEPDALNASFINSVDVSCNGGDDGSISVSVNGGTMPYTYSWSVPSIGDMPDATGLSQGPISVTVTDASGCEFPVNALINEPTPLAVAQVGGSDATCNQDNGTIDVNATGGNGTYTYTWPSPIPTGPSPRDLPAGTYIVTVTDALGCSIEESFSVNQPGQPTYSVLADSVKCFGEANGSVTLTIADGEAPFTYLWSDNSTDPDLNGVPAGNYTLTITDAIGCTYTAQASVNEPAPLSINNAAALDATCNGENSGSLAITVTGGSAPFTYNWSNNDQTDNPSSLAAGDYVVTITDKNGCSITETYTVEEPPVLELTLNVDDANCNGSSDGAITSNVSGGVGAYTFEWNDPQTTTTADLAGVPSRSGGYSLIVTDGNGCTVEASAFVDQPGPIEVLVSEVSQYGIYNVSCSDAEDGAITVRAQGSVAPYTFEWQHDGSTSSEIENLLPGTYEVLVTDNNGCTTTEAVTLTAPEPLAPALQSVDPSCFGYSNGLIYLESVAGGTAPFVYSIDGQPFNARPDFRNLDAGSYEIAIRDANGCEWQDAVTLAEPTPLVVSLVTNDSDNIIVYEDEIIISTFYNKPVSEYSWSGAFLPDCGLVDPDSCVYDLNELVVRPLETTDYTLYFVDENNCATTETIRINVEKPRLVYIPNVFSPNSTNSENQVFTIFTGRGVSKINKFEVFNRWGEVVHSLGQPTDAIAGSLQDGSVQWDGKFRGETLNPGVFVYYAEIEFTDGHIEVYTGDVTLVR